MKWTYVRVCMSLMNVCVCVVSEAARMRVDPVYAALRYGTSLAQMSRSSFGSLSESPTRSLVWHHHLVVRGYRTVGSCVITTYTKLLWYRPIGQLTGEVLRPYNRPRYRSAVIGRTTECSLGHSSAMFCRTICKSSTKILELTVKTPLKTTKD